MSFIADTTRAGGRERGPTVFATVESPVGELMLTADNVGLTGLYTSPSKYGPKVDAGWQRDDKHFAAVARQALARQRIVRLAVHPGDTTAPDILASIDRTVRHFARSHRPARYAELAA